MRRFALLLIRLYQRFMSPHKGFCRAYRVHTGRASCSQFGYRAIRRRGLWRGIGLIRQRTMLCGVAHRRGQRVRAQQLSSQSGVVDCDLPCDADCGSNVCEAAECVSCADCGDCGDCGDWSRTRGRSRRGDKYVYIPPNAKWSAGDQQAGAQE